MHLVHILLPLKDNNGKRLPRKLYGEIQKELTGKFNGLTVYSRAPAEGLWKPRRGTRRDEIIVYEVMVQVWQFKWWRQYRKRLERLLRQELVVSRAQVTINV